MTNKSEGYYSIVLESPKSRPMDISPREIAAELQCSVNTIKNRMKMTNLNYEIDETTHYQLFNYECLPILKAYLTSNHWKQSTREDVSSFLGRVASELAEDPSQSFCKYYLYNNPVFRKYVLDSDLLMPISQRLDIIKYLAERLTFEAVVNAPNQLHSEISLHLNILGELDKMILKISNYINTDTSMQKSFAFQCANCNEQNTTKLVQQWCNELIQMRKSLEYERGEIHLNIPADSSNEEIKVALNHRLEKEILDDEKLDYAKKIISLHNRIISYHETTHSLNNCSFNTVKNNIEQLMNQNITAHLTALFEGRIPPQFKCTENTMLSPMLISMVESWYYESLFTTSGMERIIASVLMLSFLQQQQSLIIADTNALLKNIEVSLSPSSSIRNFWEVMKENQYVSSTDSLTLSFSNAIDQSNLSAQIFGSKKHKNELVEHFSLLFNERRSVLPLPVILALCAVTIETFMKNHAVAYANYYAKIFEQYQNVQKSCIDGPVL